jgi:hypothetical protein
MPKTSPVLHGLPVKPCGPPAQRTSIVVSALLAGGWLVVAPAGAQTSGVQLAAWSEVAVDDLHFIRAVLRENHPGPADTLNPWFRDWYERGFHEALGLAERAMDYPGYYFAIQYYMHGFQDGHLGALGEDLLDNSHLEFRWPGFVVEYHDGEFRIAESRERELPVGATLIACDERSPETLGRTLLQTYHGVWSVPGARSDLAPLLFVDAGNPFVEPLERCFWRIGSEPIEVDLAWRTVDVATLRTSVQEARRQVSPRFGVRPFGDGAGYWISLPSFALGSEDVRSGMDSVRAVLKREGTSIRLADVLVIDVRGNGGGSSSLGEEIVEELWGSPALEAARPRGAYAEWRVSASNARFLRGVNLARLEERYGASDPDVRAYREFVEAMEVAVDRGEIFYSTGQDQAVTVTPPEASGDATPRRMEARVFFLTDHACFSACLDFADIMRRIPGVLHIGLETRADAVYIDNRAERLPSGLGLFGFSMKVYRNRARGHNESYVPELTWSGDIADDRALESWVLDLAEERGR